MKIIICCTSNPRSKKFLKKLDLVSRHGSWGRGSSQALAGITQASNWPGIKTQVCCSISTYHLLTNTTTQFFSLQLHLISSSAGKVLFLCKVPKQSKMSSLTLLNFEMLHYFAFRDEKMFISSVSSCHRNDTLINLSAYDVCCQKMGSLKRWKMWFEIKKTLSYLSDKYNWGRCSSSDEAF